MLLLLAPLATAEANMLYAPCMTPMVGETLPAQGATAVPVDIQPVALVFDGGCQLSETFLVELLEDSGDAEPTLLASETFTWSGTAAGEVLRLAPGANLAAETDHLLRITPSSGELSEVAFTTGTGAVQGLGGTPSLEASQATLYGRGADASLTVGWWLTPAPDPDGLSVVQLFDAEGVAVAADVAWGTEPLELYHWPAAEGRPREVCASAAQTDGAGRVSSVPELCQAVERSGCTTAPGPLALGPLALLLALGRRRR